MKLGMLLGLWQRSLAPWKSVVHFLSQIFIYLFKFLAALGLGCCTDFSLLVASGAVLSLQCAGFSLPWLLLLQSMGSGACGLSCPAAR